MVLAAEVLAGNATPDEIDSAVKRHAEHSDFFPKPAELLAIVRTARPAPSDDEKLQAGEARIRADNVRLMMAPVKTNVRWDFASGKPEMWLAGSPGEMRGCTDTGRVIAPMFKRGDPAGEWFVLRSDARILADFYADHNAAYRLRGNVIVAVDADGNEWTQPDDMARAA